MFFKNVLFVVDSHTEGEPTRIVLGGLPKVLGRDMVERKKFIMEKLDWIRTSVIHEPRGHIDSFGAILLPSVSNDVDFGLIFMDSGGYLDMCGHATMGVTTALIELGIVEAKEPYTSITYETPAGTVMARAFVKSGRVKEVTVRDVPSFYLKTVEVDVPGVGVVTADIAFGGNFYALIKASDVKIDIRPRNIKKIIDLALIIRKTVNEEIKIQHPVKPHINEVKLVMLYEDIERRKFRNVVVFGEGSFDRSPCGTGTAAKLATMYATDKIELNEQVISESIIGTHFKAKVVEEAEIGGLKAIIPELTGRAYITGITQVIIDPNDPLRHGFLVR